jgi:hypothetical protein
MTSEQKGAQGAACSLSDDTDPELADLVKTARHLQEMGMERLEQIAIQRALDQVPSAGDAVGLRVRVGPLSFLIGCDDHANLVAILDSVPRLT